MMTVQEIFSLRMTGHIEEAYEEARKLYAVDKGRHALSAMFWTVIRIWSEQTDGLNRCQWPYHPECT